MVASREAADRLGLTPLAEIGAYGRWPGRTPPCSCSRPNAITVACQEAADRGRDLDLIEINEAFAAVGVASARALGLVAAEMDERVNINGGAIALGHPIGASGARLVLTLALALRRRGGGTGVAALCGGGGQGDALILRSACRAVALNTSKGDDPLEPRRLRRRRQIGWRPSDLTTLLVAVRAGNRGRSAGRSA